MIPFSITVAGQELLVIPVHLPLRTSQRVRFTYEDSMLLNRVPSTRKSFHASPPPLLHTHAPDDLSSKTYLYHLSNMTTQTPPDPRPCGPRARDPRCTLALDPHARRGPARRPGSDTRPGAPPPRALAAGERRRLGRGCGQGSARARARAARARAGRASARGLPRALSARARHPSQRRATTSDKSAMPDDDRPGQAERLGLGPTAGAGSTPTAARPHEN